jgi:hypothetical protein
MTLFMVLFKGLSALHEMDQCDTSDSFQTHTVNGQTRGRPGMNPIFGTSRLNTQRCLGQDYNRIEGCRRRIDHGPELGRLTMLQEPIGAHTAS